MRFNPAGVIVVVLFFAIVLIAMRSGADATHAAEAIVTVLILLGLSRFVSFRPQRAHGRDGGGAAGGNERGDERARRE